MEHESMCIDYEELVQIVNARRQEAMASPDVRRLYSLAYMAENLANMIARTNHDSSVISVLRCVADEALAKMREMTPKDDASAKDSAAWRASEPVHGETLCGVSVDDLMTLMLEVERETREQCAKMAEGKSFMDGGKHARRGPCSVGTWHESSPMDYAMRELARCIRAANAEN